MVVQSRSDSAASAVLVADCTPAAEFAPIKARAPADSARRGAPGAIPLRRAVARRLLRRRHALCSAARATSFLSGALHRRRSHGAVRSGSIAATGFCRPRLLDRMICRALVNGHVCLSSDVGLRCWLAFSSCSSGCVCFRRIRSTGVNLFQSTVTYCSGSLGYGTRGGRRRFGLEFKRGSARSGVTHFCRHSVAPLAPRVRTTGVAGRCRHRRGWLSKCLVVQLHEDAFCVWRRWFVTVASGWCALHTSRCYV